jgi:hypothetical protein
VYSINNKLSENSSLLFTLQVYVDRIVDREKRCLWLRCGVVGAHIRAGSNQQGRA